MRALIAALLVFPTAGQADNFVVFYNGHKIHEFCQYQRGAADMYAAGVIEGSAVIEALNGNQSPICTGPNITVGQASNVMCRYLEYYPEKRHLPAGTLALTSFMDAWPCPS